MGIEDSVVAKIELVNECISIFPIHTYSSANGSPEGTTGPQRYTSSYSSYSMGGPGDF